MDVKSSLLGKLSNTFYKGEDLSNYQWDDYTIIVACVRVLEMQSEQ